SGLARIADTTVVRRRARGPVAIGHDDGRLRLTLGDRRLLLPGALEPAVRRLLDGAARPVADLADLLDPHSRRGLVRRLVREGGLRTAAGAAPAGGRTAGPALCAGVAGGRPATDRDGVPRPALDDRRATRGVGSRRPFGEQARLLHRRDPHQA